MTVKTGEAVLIAVGDELLSGLRQEANCSFLAWHLNDAGWNVKRVETVSDDLSSLVDSLKRWVGKTDLLVFSGGLGPTHDDLTREALARYLEVPLVSDPLYDKVVSRSPEAARAELEQVRESQSAVPKGTKALCNPEGTALGIAFEKEKTRVLSLPGVPREFQAMVRQELPELFFPSRGWTSVLIAGLSELTVAGRIADLVSDPSLHVSILPSFQLVELVVKGTEKRVAEAEARLRELFPEALPPGCRTLQEALLRECREKGLTLACAESCTGGLVEAALTEVPGSSQVFLGGAVTYSNEAKVRVLGVPESVVETWGAVSPECADEMARGALRVFGTDLAVSVTGVAGPEGGTPEKPVGGVWFGFALGEPDGRLTVSTQSQRFSGGREQVRASSVRFALLGLWRLAKSLPARS